MQEDFDQRWQHLAAEVMSGMKQWRLQHPRATLSQMEQALDERLGQMRARMLEDLALASSSAQLKDEAGQRLQCPQCGQVLELRGEQVRHLQTHQGQHLELARRYGSCPQCGAGFFPPR